MRTCGVLMPVASLDGPFGSGVLGSEARQFVDFLAKAGQGIWQILPLVPTGWGDSPYQSESAFAGNPCLIDPEQLYRQGLLDEEALSALKSPNSGTCTEGEALKKQRLAALRQAYEVWLTQRPVPGFDTPFSDEYYRFLFLNDSWLDDYCLFRVAKETFAEADWSQWPEPLRTRQPDALADFRREHEQDLGFWAFVQFQFHCQWQALKEYANKKSIRILGDIPIYVSADSADAWAGGDLFEIDAYGHPARVAGCPPDYFSADGQLWGNPLYNWKRHRETGYAWWCNRLEHSFRLYDLTRIDHFRGFDTYWAIPANAKTAREGRWEQGPGMDFFRTVQSKLGGLPLVAEDLGLLFDSVRHLLSETGLPGMKVLQFAFSDPWNEYLPHFHKTNCLVYTGTHDNDTLRGWANHLSAKEKAFAFDYFKVRTKPQLCEAMLRAAVASVADTCILPAADWLNLGSEARINTPGSVGGNWCWRALPGVFTPALARRMRGLCALYARCQPCEDLQG